MHFPSTSDTQDPTLSITIPTQDVTLNLTQSEAYDVLTQLSRRLVYDFDNMNYLLNADNVIAFLAIAYNDEDNHFYTYFDEDKDIISDFFELDKDTQRNMVSDALSNTIDTYEVCDVGVPVEEILEDIILHAALNLVKSYSVA
jgi:hypothetical protein